MNRSPALAPHSAGAQIPGHSVMVRPALALALLCIVSAFYTPALWTSGFAGSVYIAIHAAFTVVMLISWQRQTFTLVELFWVGAILRVALAAIDPITSNDSERYLWDGAVALSGFDPYVTAPDNPAVAELRAIWPTPLEHAQYPTLYPPAAMAIFALAAMAGPEYGIWVWKAILAGAGTLSLVFIRAALRNYGQERHFALFALSPLLVLESGIGAHLDGFLVLAVAIMIWAYSRSNWPLLGAALGWSVCIKFSPIVLLVPLFWMVRRQDFILLAAAAFAVIAAFYGAALMLGLTPIGILPTFFEKWRGGAPLFVAVEILLDGYALLIVMASFAGIGMGLAAFLAARGKGVLACLVALSVPLMVSPVVFPWYLCVLVPLLTLRPNATILLWVTSVPLTYEVLDRWLGAGVWAPASWPLFAIAFAWLIGLIIDHRYGRMGIASHIDCNTSRITKDRLE